MFVDNFIIVAKLTVLLTEHIRYTISRLKHQTLNFRHNNYIQFSRKPPVNIRSTDANELHQLSEKSDYQNRHRHGI